MHTIEAIESLLHKQVFPRSAQYDAAWVLNNQMGPNALWLAEWLTEKQVLQPGMRVLDLGCGRALTSIFLAREFKVQVWATDFWITQDYNWQRIVAAQVDDLVFPIRAEAHSLPFPEGFFDAIISIDAYQYFGTDALYLGYLSRFLRPHGSLGVVMPALMQPLVAGAVPEHLAQPQSNGKAFWEDGCWSFKTAAWWEESWKRNSTVTEVQVDTLPDGWRYWRDFEQAIEAAGTGIFPSYSEALDADQGRYIGFVRALAKRTDAPAMNLYDPALATRMGVDR